MRRRPSASRRAIIAAVACTLLVGPAQAIARSSAVVDCHRWASFPNVLISSARNMSCRAAARDMRRYRGNIDQSFRTPGGFRCRQQTGVPEGGQWRCVRRTRAYRFEFRD
jgi:hypothetical protein